MKIKVIRKFRVPRKLKKKLKKEVWFYPMDEKDRTYQIAFPSEDILDFIAWKTGNLFNLLDEIKKQNKDELS